MTASPSPSTPAAQAADLASQAYDRALEVIAAVEPRVADGTIGHRFYAGCQNVDTVEALAAEHARELFGAEYAYAQPHSGIDANLVAFWSILAHRVETPALQKLGAKNVNELSEEDWESLRDELGNQRLLGMSLDA